MFELTDAERESLGLDPVPPTWRRVTIGTVAAFPEGDTLRKYLHVDDHGYLEVDTELATRGGEVLLPSVGRDSGKDSGKERKLSPAVLLVQERARGRWFQATFPRQPGQTSYVRALNTRNMRSLSFWDDESLGNFGDLRRYLSQRATGLDETGRTEIAEMKSAPRQQARYAPGDIFRFRLDARRFGFGLILGCLKDIRNWGVLADDHPLNSVMTVPLFVRAFRCGTPEATIDPARLADTPLLPARLMMDGQIYWGDYPIAARRALKPDDIDFPMGHGVSPGRDKFTYFYWGFGLQKEMPPVEDAVATLGGRSIGAFSPDLVAAALEGGAGVDRNDLRHADHAATRARLFEAIGYRGATDYASYAAWADCMSPQDFVARTSASYRASSRKNMS